MYRIIGDDGQQYGPVSLEKVGEWIAHQQADGATLVQKEGSPSWVPLRTLPELAAFLSPESPPPIPSSPNNPAPNPGLPSDFTPTPSSPPPPNYLVPAIVLTLCCCPVFGFPAMYYASRVNARMVEGDLEGAKKASTQARLWCWIALIVGVILQFVSSMVYENLIKSIAP